MKAELCPGCRISTPKAMKDKWSKRGQLEKDFVHSMLSTFGGGYVRNVHRIKVKCSECGRKVVPSVRTCEDGCCLIMSIPAHKPKGWWKK